MKRIISLLLVAVMLVLACPISVFAAEQGAVISRYTDYSKDFTATISEQIRNEAGLEKDAYGEWLKQADTFAINQGNGPWKVGEYKPDGSFDPFTRILAMCYDTTQGEQMNSHDLNWASTEKQYLDRVDGYLSGFGIDNYTEGGVTIWNGATPMWQYYAKQADSPRNRLTGSDTVFSAMVYTVENDCTVNFSMDAFEDTDNHYFGIFVDGVMIWPTAGGKLAKKDMYACGTNANVASVNAALTTANGTELKAGQEVAFVVGGGGLALTLSPVLTEYVSGYTVVNLVDTYGVNSSSTTVESGSDFVLPTYQGDLIFMGWDANGDGTADYADGATVKVPELKTFTLTAIVVEPARFGDNMPTIEDGTTVFHGGWTIGRYEPATGEYIPFTENNGSHLYTPGTGGMWGATGGGFYVGSPNGQIAMSGCTPDGPFVNQIQYAVDYNGKISLDFTQLTICRNVNAGDEIEPSYMVYDLALYKNGEKIWPAEGDWYNYTSENTYSTTTASFDLLVKLHEDGEFPITMDAASGDVFEWRTRSGNKDCYFFYSKPTVTYTKLYETPVVSDFGVTVGGNDLGLNIYVNVIGATEGTTAGAIYWTTAQTAYDPATGTDFGTGTVEGDLTKFTYGELVAKQMADVLYVMPYSKSADKTYYGTVQEVSIAKYAELALAADGVPADLRTFLIDMVNYGAEAQKYFDYNTDNLANAFLSKEDAKVRKVSDLANVYAQTGDGAKITTVSMICGNQIGFKFMTDAVEGATTYVLQFADNPEFTDATEVAMVATAIGDEYKAITYVGITETATTVYARVVIDGEAGATLTYSVESFFARTKDTLDDGFYHLTLAMVAFGRSAAALA